VGYGSTVLLAAGCLRVVGRTCRRRKVEGLDRPCVALLLLLDDASSLSTLCLLLPVGSPLPPAMSQSGLRFKSIKGYALTQVIGGGGFSKSVSHRAPPVAMTRRSAADAAPLPHSLSARLLVSGSTSPSTRRRS
jgi:hypothetical protein